MLLGLRVVTIFTIPKPFKGHIGIIQYNAINSWSRLHPDCEIILCGDEIGTKDIVKEFNIKHFPDIAHNEYGTPRIDSAFDEVRRRSKHRLICYANADIILLHDFIQAIKRIKLNQFLIVGQRWDLTIIELLDLEHEDWEKKLLWLVSENGKQHPPIGSDYFVFLRDSFIKELPPFVVGRPGWDNWMIYKARSHGIPVIDASKSVTLIHQQHDYSHIKNQSGEMWEGPEADRNKELMGGMKHSFTLRDATHILTPKYLLPRFSYNYFRRRWQTLPLLNPKTKPIVRFVNGVYSSLKSIFFTSG